MSEKERKSIDTRKPIEPEDRLKHVDSGPIPNDHDVVQRARAPGSDVTNGLLRSDGDRADSWLHYNKGLEQTGYSPADRLTPATVDTLGREYTVNVVPGIGDCVGKGMEANPTIVPGDPPVMYLSQGKMHVNALNARTGEGYWKFRYGIEEIDDSGVRNRGVAVWKDKVYFAVPDETPVHPRLIALNRYTGEKQWERTLLTKDQQDEGLDDRVFITQEPMLFDGTVLIGQSSDKAGWTYLQAFDAESGDRKWRYRCAPKDEWVGESWKFSSAAAWMTPTVDPDTGTVFFALTNPDPMLNGVVRPGPNKHTQSIVALDVETGEEKWTSQMLPHELWDYDAHSPPFVFDVKADGRVRRAVGHAGKAGWLYVYDAENGRLLERSAGFAKQDHWGEGYLNLPPAGKNNKKEMWPGLNGAKEWLPESYSPRTGLYYAGSNDNVMTVAYDPDWAYDPEKSYADAFASGGFFSYPETGDVSCSVVAIDPASGDIRWKRELDDVSFDSPVDFKFTGGTTATAGNLVFHASAGGHLYAFNAETGEYVWRDDTGGRISAQPIVWDDPVAQKQYVAVPSLDNELVVYAGSG